tara:strand:- start:117 stop:1106 length:990 start_codon:yes stop_codon:yes gene_type:complete
MKNRIFSGMRPTGKLHIGNYFGALENWVKLQDEFECVYSIVDIHALTTVTGNETKTINSNIREMVLDWLAVGIDPEKSIVFIQSQVPEVMSLHSLLSMITPMGWLLRVPTFKEKVRQMDETEESVNYGLVGYPVLQTADIILYKANVVPVGEDQVPHIELAREIVRRFNNLFGNTFPEPQPKLTKSRLIKGLDGQQKMSKSLNNHIDMSADNEETIKKLKTAFTDPQRIKRNIPGRPEMCNVYSLHQAFNSNNLKAINKECSAAERGCVECKIELGENINSFLQEIRERRMSLEQQPKLIEEILEDGKNKAKKIAQNTINEVYEKMGLS